MTSVLNVDTIADKAGTGPVALTKQATLKAYIKADSTAALTANGTFNISSGTDHSTGDYSYAVTNAYSSVNHYVQTCIQEGASQGHGGTRNTDRHSASVIAVDCFNQAGTVTDISHNMLTAGDLA